MAHWAKLDENNVVVNITVGNNDDIDEGYEWLITNIGGRWVKTSYNTYAGIHKNNGTPLRKNYAVIGGVYDSVRDAFIPPKHFNSWVLDEDTCQWQAPTPMPTEGRWRWDESTTSWVEVAE